MPYKLTDEQQSLLESEKNWRADLEIGQEVQIYYWPIGSSTTGMVTDLTRKTVDVDTSREGRKFTFNRETGIALEGTRKEDKQIIDRYAVRPGKDGTD